VYCPITSSILARKSRRRDWRVREATEKELHNRNLDRENGFSLRWSWKPLFHFLKERNKFFRDKAVTLLCLGS
jgi:hypothetical protein